MNGLSLRITMQDEFYAVAFRKKLYGSLEQLQQDLDEWMHYYNHERPHSGRYCYGKTPIETFKHSKSMAEEKMLDRVPLENQNQTVSPGIMTVSTEFGCCPRSVGTRQTVLKGWFCVLPCAPANVPDLVRWL